jgi:hypothetical protein
MNEEKAQIIAYLQQMGDVSEMVKVEETFAEEVSDENPASLGGTAEKTVWSEDQKRVLSIKKRGLIYTHDGFLISDTRFIAGRCVVCKEKGKNNVLSKASARRCARLDTQAKSG